MDKGKVLTCSGNGMEPYHEIAIVFVFDSKESKEEDDLV